MQSTQQQYPWRATVRTILAVVIGLVLGAGLVLPELSAIASEELGGLVHDRVLEVLAQAAGVAVAVAAFLTRVMAIPLVDRALRWVGLSSAPRSVEDVDAGPPVEEEWPEPEEWQGVS